MNNKQQKTLDELFKNPVSRNLRYNNVKSMLKALGVDVEERSEGSRVSLRFKSQTRVIHKPHPGNILLPYAILAIREFLSNAGVKT